MIISDPVTCSSHDTQPCGHPVCFTDQRTHSLLSSSVPFTQTGSTSPHTHTHTHTHTHRLTHSPPPHTQPHTTSHTFPHSSHTPHSPSLTHTYSSHTLIHHLNTPHTLHKHIHSSHPHTPSHTHTHSHTHTPHTVTHTLSHSPHLHTYTHTHKHKHKAYRGTDTGNTGTQGQCSHTRHVEHVGTAQSPSWISCWNLHTLGATGTLEAPRGQVRQPRGLRLTQLCPDQNSLLCRICHYDQWTPHRRWTSIHSRSASFSVKNTKTAAPQLQTPFPSSRPALPATDPGKRGSSYLDHPPRC